MSRYHERPWGGFEILYADESTWTKILYVEPGQSLSLQIHHLRDELWVPLDEGGGAMIGYVHIPLRKGQRYEVPRGHRHRIYNKSTEPVSILEVATGQPQENDIIRLQDDYGR